MPSEMKMLEKLQTAKIPVQFIKVGVLIEKCIILTWFISIWRGRSADWFAT
jgi:hypothetical protein